MHPSEHAAFTRDDVDAFIRVAQHAMHTGGLDPVSREVVSATLIVMLAELDDVDPRWDLLRIWGREVIKTLRQAARPAALAGLEPLPWP